MINETTLKNQLKLFVLLIPLGVLFFLLCVQGCTLYNITYALND